jgi:hypothetical protein
VNKVKGQQMKGVFGSKLCDMVRGRPNEEICLASHLCVIPTDCTSRVDEVEIYHKLRSGAALPGIWLHKHLARCVFRPPI